MSFGKIRKILGFKRWHVWMQACLFLWFFPREWRHLRREAILLLVVMLAPTWWRCSYRASWLHFQRKWNRPPVCSDHCGTLGLTHTPVFVSDQPYLAFFYHDKLWPTLSRPNKEPRSRDKSGREAEGMRQRTEAPHERGQKFEGDISM